MVILDDPSLEGKLIIFSMVDDGTLGSSSDVSIWFSQKWSDPKSFMVMKDRHLSLRSEEVCGFLRSLLYDISFVEEHEYHLFGTVMKVSDRGLVYLKLANNHSDVGTIWV